MQPTFPNFNSQYSSFFKKPSHPKRRAVKGGPCGAEASFLGVIFFVSFFWTSKRKKDQPHQIFVENLSLNPLHILHFIPKQHFNHLNIFSFTFFFFKKPSYPKRRAVKGWLCSTEASFLGVIFFVYLFCKSKRKKYLQNIN
jgi:hypothetical protein